ncbi:hypothetical protein LCGC14_3164240 [marine sediment metagenome]|uniref:Uncharacterized protein n=1 Tax=marine sediment metagenome TaxID=412755 RepID=A0A0F8WDM8_9ZZZZ
MPEEADVEVDWEKVKRLRAEVVAADKAYDKARQECTEAGARQFAAHELAGAADKNLNAALWPVAE